MKHMPSLTLQTSLSYEELHFALETCCLIPSIFLNIQNACVTKSNCIATGYKAVRKTAECVFPCPSPK